VGEEREIHGFLWPNLRERNRLEDLGIGDGRIILKMNIQEMKWAVDWNELAHDRDNLWALCG
jgi:hypothetical protein